MQHVAELEQGILRPVESSEAGSRKVYPSQVEYTLQKNQEDGTLKRRKVRKVRGCLNGKNWDGDNTGDERVFGILDANHRRVVVASSLDVGSRLRPCKRLKPKSNCFTFKCRLYIPSKKSKGGDTPHPVLACGGPSLSPAACRREKLSLPIQGPVLLKNL